MIFAGLAIPDVSVIDTGRVRYLSSHDKILGVLELVHREFRRSGLPAIVGNSDVSHLTDIWCSRVGSSGVPT